jgi:hypothetical protein
LHAAVGESARVGDPTALGSCVTLLAEVAVRRGRRARAARLLGAAEGLCGSVASELFPPFGATYERLRGELRRQLGERAFAELRAWGASCPSLGW